jgi:hypothetical protein
LLRDFKVGRRRGVGFDARCASGTKPVICLRFVEEAVKADVSDVRPWGRSPSDWEKRCHANFAQERAENRALASLW